MDPEVCTRPVHSLIPYGLVVARVPSVNDPGGLGGKAFTALRWLGAIRLEVGASRTTGERRLSGIWEKASRRLWRKEMVLVFKGVGFTLMTLLYTLFWSVG